MVVAPEYRRTSYGREDRNVNLGVINVPVRSKTTGSSGHNHVTRPTMTSSPSQQHRSRLHQPQSSHGSSHRRSSSVSHTRSMQGEERDGPPAPASGHRKALPSKHQKQHQSLYELECDYDTNPTNLYELLESSAWEKARLRCRTHPEEVRTWIVRKDKNNMVRWKLLPLHAAIIFQSPSFVVSTLLERFPAAAMRQDDQGMLPLHLAFRHKQEDEDLLELLLLENPRAVHQRDRRDRIPLEHGRESRYSAKLMRLYAEAAVSTSQHASNTSHKPVDHHTHATPTTAPSSPMAATTVSLTHLHRVEMEHEAKLAKVRADYEYEMEQLKSRHEDQLASLKEDLSLAKTQAEQDVQRERRSMQVRHEEELEQLRRELDHQVEQHQAMQDDLQKEILQLQVSVEEAKHQEESMAEKYGKLVTVNVQMKQFLEDLSEEQIVLQDLAQKQQDYLEAARMIRNELVQTLLKQEDSDGTNERLKGTQMIEIGDRVQRKIKEFMKANVIQNDLVHDEHHDYLHKLERRGPSRIEVEREERIYSIQEGATEVQAATPIFADSNEPDESVMRKSDPEMRRADSFYDENDLEMLADEVSAITENSGY